ncbi:MAG: GntR family transcriptional regulator [Bacillaceae bacterium]|nr:GntR family transcriptional regulator [Bacillaceae bacterium]
MNIIISNTSQEPIYKQIVNQIKTMIMNGDLEESQPLPSIRSLARDLQISVITTKRAYDELEKEGYLVTVPGKGSYVSAKNPEFLKETRLRLVEEKLSEAIRAARTAGLGLDDLQELLQVLYEEEP